MVSKYLVIGTVPPPRGGVAMYLKRKVASLSARGFDVEWHNPRKIFGLIGRLCWLKVSPEKPIAEIHTAHWFAVTLSLMLRVEPYLIFYDHNYSSGFCKRRWFSRFFLKRFLKKVRGIVVVSDHLKENYLSLVPDEIVASIKVETPYIPLSEVGSMGSSDYPEELKSFIDQQEYVFVNSAWRLVDDVAGNDLYGLKDSLKAFLGTYSGSEKVGLVLIVGSPTGVRYEELKALAEGRVNVFILPGEHDLCGVLNLAGSVLLRTTSTDGDSLSVREALELNRPVIASDVVNRPGGTVTYKYGTEGSLEAAMLSIVKFKFSEQERK